MTRFETVAVPLGERLARICLLLGEAFQAETFADHVDRVAGAREAHGDAFTAAALRSMARSYQVRALEAWGAIASLNAEDAPVRDGGV